MNVERFGGRDLSPGEARALAQQALDNEELFDALVAQGAVETSLSSAAVQAGLSAPVRRAPWVIAFCAVAAALLVGLFLWRASSGPVIHPSLAMGAARPVVLASNLIAGTSSNADFRGDGGVTREPRSTGTVVAIEDGQVTINLGAIDGIEQGAKLGPIVITSVFRDHARGSILPGGHVKVNQSVQLPPAVHIAAVVQEADALAAAGNLNAARTLARNALADGSAGETRTLLERLGALDYRAGATASAFEDYKTAVRSFPAPPAASASEQAATLNSLGVVYLLRGDLEEAAKALHRAAELADNAQIQNNLGVLAEMRGNMAQARENYRRALDQSSGRDRAAAQSNLARVMK